MSKKDEALKQAQERLELWFDERGIAADAAALSAIREALMSVPDGASEANEQPRGEATLAPVAEPHKQQCRTDGRCQYAIDSLGHCSKGKCVMTAQQQEPEGVVIEGYEDRIIHWRKGFAPSVGTKLYTSPPASKPCKVWDAEGYDALCQQLEGWKAKASKPWVGLTNQELIDLTSAHSGAALYCAIEAKLKEKNHG